MASGGSNRCCDNCNAERVIPARMAELNLGDKGKVKGKGLDKRLIKTKGEFDETLNAVMAQHGSLDHEGPPNEAQVQAGLQFMMEQGMIEISESKDKDEGNDAKDNKERL